jgi:D-alanyl-D-alanine carboxypeptidase
LTEVPPAAAFVIPDPPPCRSATGEILLADVPAAARRPADWAGTLVDPLTTLGRDYVPPDLVPVSRAGIGGGGSVRKLVVDDLRALDRAARSAGVHLRVVSAYRSYRKQQSTFAHWVAVGGYRQAVATSARPGHSEHQLGTAIDFGEAGRPDPWNQSFGSTKAGRWLLVNAAQFGFVGSYPAGRQDEVCYDPEPWHFRYVGRADAMAIAASGLTLRTWLWRSSAAALSSAAGSAASGDLPDAP